jgi:hypothetical protein
MPCGDPHFPDQQVSVADFGVSRMHPLIPKHSMMPCRRFPDGWRHTRRTQGIWSPDHVFAPISTCIWRREHLSSFRRQGSLPACRDGIRGSRYRRCQSPISGRNLENIAIRARGRSTGQARRGTSQEGKVTEAHWRKVVARVGQC